MGMSMHEEVRHFIVEHFLFGEDDGLSDDESLTDSGVINSTGVLELVGFLEETFAIEVDPEELVPANLDTVNRVVDLIRRKKQA